MQCVHLHYSEQNFHWNLKGFFAASWIHLAQLSHLNFKECHSELCGMFGIPRNALSFAKLISSSGTSTKREAAAIITSAEVILAEYDAILSQWERANFYNHLSNYSKDTYISRYLTGLFLHCQLIVKTLEVLQTGYGMEIFSIMENR